MGSTVIRLTGIVVALVVGACGDDANNRKIIDAPAIGRDEGMIDGPQNSPVTVTVKNQGPTPNIEVYFQNADSTLVATAHTDTNGIASQVMDAGGFVTLVDPYLIAPPGFGGGNELVTWAGVKPGDHLVLDNSSVQMLATVTFELPLAIGAASYNFYASCNNTVIPYSTPTGTGISTVNQQVALDGCGGTADLLLVANDIDNQPVSYFYVPAQPINDGDTVDYTAKTFTTVVQRAFEFDNNASGDNAVTIGDQFVTSRGQIFQQNLSVGGTTVATTFAEPGLPTGALDVVTTQQSVANTDRNTVAWGPTAADYTVDYAASLLGDFAVDPSLDTGTHAMSWTLGVGKAAQFAIGGVFASRLSATPWSWQIIGPSGTQLQLPTLPTDVADFNIVATDSFTIETIGIGAAPGGYDAYRANAFAGPPGVIGASGTAAFNQWQAPPSTAPSVFKKLFAPKRVVAPRRVWSKH